MVNPEWWLLETAVRYVMPLWAVVHCDIEGLLNQPGHGLPRAALLQLLERMLWEGDIFVADEADRRELFTATQLDAGSGRDRNRFHYGLTEKGGAKWESWARPKWKRYVDCHHRLSSGTSPERVEMLAEDRGWLESFRDLYFQEFGVQTISETEFLDQITPWPATYWKTLPSAWRFRCVRSKDEAPNRSHDTSPRDAYQAMTDWYRHAWNDSDERPNPLDRIQ